MVIRPIPLISTMCLGIILALTCYANFPALQPEFEIMWALSKMESGLIFGIFYGGVLAGTPLLSPLADRSDPRRVWMFSAGLMALSIFCFAFLAQGFWTALLFRGLTGMGLSGVYMPGLKILSDRLEGPAQTRAAVFYTATTMALYSMAGFGAGLVGPFVFGAALDLFGDKNLMGWGFAYTSIGLAALGAPLAMKYMGLKDDPGT